MSISLMVSFGLPRHFHLLLCNCLVLSLFVFCGKSNKVTKLQSYKSCVLHLFTVPKTGVSHTINILLASFFPWFRTVNYESSSSAKHAGHKSMEKNSVCNLQYRPMEKNEANKRYILKTWRNNFEWERGGRSVLYLTDL